jgi:hypothetical protein
MRRVNPLATIERILVLAYWAASVVDGVIDRDERAPIRLWRNSHHRRQRYAEERCRTVDECLIVVGGILIETTHTAATIDAA